ncbi:alpha/beta fold hydrolase [Synechococcus sp. PCC 6312]|uniref:alpha/beta fold hydrolase n=1 Tax=Synechococcus sp. (strain ATCC 27167 / PCC 6312) TaxID=195253 RepID=UPI00029F0A02|nr:alpha/beta fold hydrolase [Synechococcus sp. PCC 6312]AFY60047.1 putative hydrolase or acyltransferase of alpha/beta superfamily [Synechococcus sp. PCC 6312]
MNRNEQLQDQYVKVGSVNTRYWQTGDSGSTVILLHGGGGYIELWKHNIFELATHHRVYAFDMVGAGRSDKIDANYTFDFMAHFTRDFLKALNIPKASLIGTSAGGGVALTFALNFPELVDRLILVGSAGLGKDINFLLRITTLPGLGKLFSAPSKSGVAMLCKQAVYDSNLITDEIVEEFYQMATLPGAAEATLNLGRSNFSIWGQFYQPILKRLQTVTAPTLIIWGRQDTMVPVSHGQKAAKLIPNARLEIFDECGHWSPIEHPQKFNQLVLEFLA